MFHVTPKKHLPEGVTLVSGGSVFGRWDIPLEFNLATDTGIADATIRLEVKTSEKTGEQRLENGKIENGVIPIIIHNASKKTPTFSIDRVFVVSLISQNKDLNLSFVIYPLEKANIYIFAYEFYEEDTPPSVSSKDGEVV